MTDGDEQEAGSASERTPLLGRPALWAALLAIAIIVAFGPAIEGELVWDDATMVGAAVALRSPLDAFSRDFFALGASAAGGAGASYFRPLVTLSFALDVKLFSSAPHFGLHLANLVWHVVASVLVAGALARWTRGSSLQGKAACWLAAGLWAVLPAKAENVAWISGRGDVMALALLLAGLSLRAREVRGAGRAAVRVALVAAATLLALLCKESLVVAPLLVAIEVDAEREREAGRARVLRAVRAPETLASAIVVLLYLAARHAYLPLHGGGEAMFAGLSAGDRVALSIETIGHAAQALLLCFEAHLLRGPIGFSAPFVLERDGGAEIFGAAFLLALVAIAWRAPRLRPAALLLAGALLPVANIVPSGLESRFSDRFLYVPSLGVALGAAALLADASEKPFRAAALGVATFTIGLMLVASRRSTDFRSSTTLWEHERRHGQRAPTVLHNAATAALRGRRYEDARDRLVETAQRYGELGFDEGYPYLARAVEAQIRATGEGDPSSYAAYRKLLLAWLAGAPPAVRVPFTNGHALTIPITTPAARAYASGHAREIRLALALLDARSGDARAEAVADAEVSACPRCRGVLRAAARVELALARPDRALPLLARLGPDEDAASDALDRVAKVQVELRKRGDEASLARALFVGEAYTAACRVGLRALGEDRDAAASAARETIAVACLLAGDAASWRKAKVGLVEKMTSHYETFGVSMFRHEPAKRLALAEGR
jgi:hypothetical protein